MILVDTSVWVDHLRRTDSLLVSLLGEGQVLSHPFVVGELACGRLVDRLEVIELLTALPAAEVLEHEEALRFVDEHDLAGSGLGWLDVHLLGSSVLARAEIWTRDRSLVIAARRLGVSWQPVH